MVSSGDFRDPDVLPAGRFDLVTGTPPYLPIGSGTESPRAQFGPCHFEHRGGIEDYCVAARASLDDGGVFVICAGVEQDGRVRAAAAVNGMAILRRVEVRPRAGKRVLFSVYAMTPKLSAAGEAAAHLVVRDVRGQWTEQFAAVREEMGLPPRQRGARRSRSAD
jgi:tRNA1(Val) A37 N6-methylase TrmN6